MSTELADTFKTSLENGLMNGFLIFIKVAWPYFVALIALKIGLSYLSKKAKNKKNNKQSDGNEKEK